MAISLTASESSESDLAHEDALPDSFESDGNFAASAMQLMGHFLAPGRIPPPTLATDSDDSDAEEIKEYAATCMRPSGKDTQISKCPILCSAHVTGTCM